MKYDSEEYVYMIETDHGINRGFAVQVDYFEIDPADMHAGEYEQKHISYTIQKLYGTTMMESLW